MNNEIKLGTDAVTMFCRLQMNIKRDIPIRPSEMGALIYIYTQKEPVTPIMISQFFRVSKPSVTAMVNSLVKKDYIIKTPSSEDGRRSTLGITYKGVQLVEEAYNEYYKSMELLKKDMGEEEFKQLIQLIQKANEILCREKSGQ